MPPTLPTTLRVAPYVDQAARWPAEGRHILALHDDREVVVYQAYRPSIAEAAVADGKLGGGGFSLGRMSWIKPNFLWMMFRAGWATKEGQERVLALHLERAAFEALLARAVPSSHVPALYPDERAWHHAVKVSDVRLQWDPDHLPGGAKAERRAIQIGLRDEALRAMVEDHTLAIEDITPFVIEQRAHASSPYTDLLTPDESVLVPRDPEVARRLGLSPVR